MEFTNRLVSLATLTIYLLNDVSWIIHSSLNNKNQGISRAKKKKKIKDLQIE